MDYQLISLALLILNMLASAGTWLYVMHQKKHQATENSVKELRESVNKRLNEKCQRISELEAKARAAPSKHEIVRLHERIDEINKNTQETHLMLGELIGQIKQINFMRKSDDG